MNQLELFIAPKRREQSIASVKLRHITHEELARVLREDNELFNELEPGQNYGAFPLGYSVNSLK